MEFQDIGMASLGTQEWAGRQRGWMSKARLVITAVTAEGLSQGEAARRYGVSQGQVSELMAR